MTTTDFANGAFAFNRYPLAAADAGLNSSAVMWTCVGGSSFLLSRTVGYGANLVELGSADETWTDPPQNWTLVNGNLDYVQPLNSVIVDSSSSTCKCRVWDPTLNEWMFATGLDMFAYDFFHGSLDPPYNWYNLSASYDPSNTDDTAGLQAVYVGDEDTGIFSQGYYEIVPVTVGAAMTSDSRFWKVDNPDNTPFTLRVHVPDDTNNQYRFQVYEVSGNSNGGDAPPPLGDVPLLDTKVSVVASTNDATPFGFNAELPEGSYYQIWITTIDDLIIDDENGNCTLAADNGVLLDGGTVTVSLQDCDKAACDGGEIVVITDKNREETSYGHATIHGVHAWALLWMLVLVMRKL